MKEMIPFGRNPFPENDEVFSSLVDRFFGDEFFAMMKDTVEPFQRKWEPFLVEIEEDDEQYRVEAKLDGVEEENLYLNFEDNCLTIQARAEYHNEHKNGNQTCQQRHFGQFSRKFRMEDVEEKQVCAKLQEGVLEIILPKRNKDKK